MKFLSASLRLPAIALLLIAACNLARADDAPRAIEQALGAAQQDKRGVNLYVGGQVIPGIVVRVEPGQWVELRSQQFSRIIVRLDRIDALAQP